jgi:hypothetical protein
VLIINKAVFKLLRIEKAKLKRELKRNKLKKKKFG